jgi:uncharacterized protein
MAHLYNSVMARSPDKDEQKAIQTRWRTNYRDRCQDAGCLTRAYADREQQLRAALGR